MTAQVHPGPGGGPAEPGGVVSAWVRLQGTLAPILAIAFVVGVYFALADPVRHLEAALVGWMGPLLSSAIEGRGLGATILLDGSGGRLAADVTRSCSATVPVAVQVSVAAFLLPGAGRPRAVAALVASAAVGTANLARILILLIIGSRFGADGLVILHDWVGTIISFVAAALGLVAMVAIVGRSALEAD